MTLIGNRPLAPSRLRQRNPISDSTASQPRFGLHYLKPPKSTSKSMLSALFSRSGNCGILAFALIGIITYVFTQVGREKVENNLKELNSIYEEHIKPSGAEAQFETLNDQFNEDVPYQNKCWALDRLEDSSLDEKQKAIILAKGFQDFDPNVSRKAELVTNGFLKNNPWTDLDIWRAFETMVRNLPRHYSHGHPLFQFYQTKRVSFDPAFKTAIQNLARHLGESDLILNDQLLKPTADPSEKPGSPNPQEA